MNLVDILDSQNLSRVPDRDYGTDKNTWHSYISNFYEERFLPYKEKSISLLEIGIEFGASLKLWCEYFTNGDITGLDITNEKLLSEFNSSAKVIIGDAYSDEIANSLGKFDIIIDDASHHQEDTLKLLELYLPKLNPGGLFVIEDIQNEGYFQDFTPTPSDETSDLPSKPQVGWTGIITKFNEVCAANKLTNLSYEIIDLRQKSQRYDDLMFVITAS